MNWILDNWELISLLLFLVFMIIREIARVTKTKKDDQIVEYVSNRLEEFGVKLDVTPSYVVDKLGEEIKKRSEQEAVAKALAENLERSTPSDMPR